MPRPPKAIKAGKPKRGPGRPKKVQFPEINDDDKGSNDLFLENDNSLPGWDWGERTSSAQNLPTDELLDKFQELDFQENVPSPPDDVAKLIDEYHTLLDDHPEIRLREDFLEHQFHENSSPEEVQRAINRARDIINWPLIERLSRISWKYIAVFLELGLQKLPGKYGQSFSTQPTPANPRPVSVADALCTEDVFKEVLPVVKELIDNNPALGLLRHLANPHYRLGAVVAGAVVGVYSANNSNSYTNKDSD